MRQSHLFFNGSFCFTTYYMLIFDYFEQLQEESQRALFLASHELILEVVPQVECGIKWNIPFYTYLRGLCYLNWRTDHLQLGFPYGVELNDDFGILIPASRKQVRHIAIYSMQDLGQEAVLYTVQEAARRNEQYQRERVK